MTFTPHLAGSNVLGRGMERFRFSPWGVAGGKAGGLARTIKNYGRPDEEELGKIDMLEIAPGDTITVKTPGGGGYGSPLERDPAAVADDVSRGFVTVTGALDDYGVVIRDGVVDIEATQRLRGQREASKQDTPFFDFGPEREKWERVFDSARMRRINRAIMALPSTQRLTARDKIFEPMIKLLRKGIVLDERALMLVSPAVEQNLIELEKLATGSTAHDTRPVMS
jgi:N-methylhydantoinase B